MLSMLQNWQGKAEVNGVLYNSVREIPQIAVGSTVCIKLYPKTAKLGVVERSGSTTEVEDKQREVRITVKKYMTQKSEPGFDFMAKWNNDIPMPYRTMTGIKTKETRGMVYMKLHGDIWAEKITTCMCCGKKLSNPVSQYFGIGPECGGHNYVNPFEDDDQLKEAVASMKKKLVNVTWEGWVIKSAITEEVEA